jgi:hypothetical protein
MVVGSWFEKCCYRVGSQHKDTKAQSSQRLFSGGFIILNSKF